LEARFPYEVREEIENCAVRFVLNGSLARALVPFICLDSDPRLISKAALDYAVLRQPDPDLGEFTGPRMMLQLASPDSGQPEDRRAGVLQGLVLLGDRRLLPFLDGCWRLLGTEGRSILTSASSPHTTAGLIEFYLRWLEQTDDESDFGGVLGTLCRLPDISADGMVYDIERAFPASLEEPPVRRLQGWTFADYYEIIRPQLGRLIKRESEPKLTPQLALYWGAR
jgi:hypothetical protein